MPPESPASLPQPAPRLADLEEELVEGLAEHLPGLEILDRRLLLSGGGEGRALRADLVAIDACGRLVLILLVEGNEDETVFVGLESVVLLRANRALLAQSLRVDRPWVDAPALVVLVAEVFSGRVVRALAGASPRELRLFEMRELSSAEGRRSTFVPVGIASGSAPGVRVGDRAGELPAAAGSRADFLDLVPANLRPTAEACLAEIDRVDLELECRPGFDGVTWRYGRQSLCSLTWTGERLLGVIASKDAACPLRHVADVRAFVDGVVGEHLRRLARAGHGPVEGASGARGTGATTALEVDSGVLLSPEEIAAFRD